MGDYANMESAPISSTLRLWKLIGIGGIVVSLAMTVTVIVLAVENDSSSEAKGPGPDPDEVSSEFFPLGTPDSSWDLSSTLTREVSYTVDEGTWMNVDVSPNGDEIVFDLLGDIYTIPIGGGSATVVRDGPSFDTQPRYLPDGSIVYTSDASGCDNVWLLEGETPRQLSDSTYRWVSNPIPSADGANVYAIKWYYTSRSLGAGELYSFSVADAPSSGEQLVGRIDPDSQIGPEEPFPSPDGQYVYYSQNVADSMSYQYSKDPHKGIYAIKRVSLSDGSVETVVSGYGGASRPILSHSGDTMAFVRRRRFDTALILRDMRQDQHGIVSGDETVLNLSLDHDQQASYAPWGTYPRFAFMPDDSAIVIWSGGKIVSIDVSDASVTEIPFSVDVNLDLGTTVGAPVDASSGDPFDTRVVHSFDTQGDKTVFSAVGYAYVANGASVERLTSDDDSVFEFTPTFDDENDDIVYMIRYNDVDLATIVKVVVSSGEVTELANLPRGRYADPVVHGDTMVVARLGTDSLSGIDAGLQTGLYKISNLANPADVTVSLLSSAGGRPNCMSTDGDYVLVQSGTSAVQVSVADGSRTTLASSPYASEVAVNPDMDYVAVVEFSHVFVSPLQVGEGVTSHPDESPNGLRRISAVGGGSLRWVGPTTLAYTLGADLYTVDVVELFKECPENGSYPDYEYECAQATVTVSSLSISYDSDIPDDVYAFVNAQVVTMDPPTEDSILADGVVIVTGDRITDVGDAADITIPPEATVIDVDGGVIVPGFIDMHAHWAGANSPSRFHVQQSWEFLVNLAFGVTTLHNPSADTMTVFSDSELVRAGRKIGPRLFSTGTIIYGAEASYRVEINSLEDARNALKRLQAYGAFSVKSYNQVCRSSRQMVLEAARELGMSVVPEGGMNLYWNLNQIIDGHTTIEHSLPVAPLYNDVKELFVRSGTGYTPTFVVSYGGIWGEMYWYMANDLWENERVMEFSPNAPVEAASIRRTKAPDADFHHFRIAESATEISRMGGKISPGAHGQRQGIGFHWELWSMAQGGMTNFEVLKSATADPADAMNFSDLGRITTGALADLVFYNGNSSPLVDIDNSEDVMWVLKDGRLYDATTMDQLQPEFVPLPQGAVHNTPVIAGTGSGLGAPEYELNEQFA